MKFTERNCPVCLDIKPYKEFAKANFDLESFDENSFSSRKIPEYMHFRLLECNSCSCIYASPALSQEDLSQLYKSAAFKSSIEANYAAKTYVQLILNNSANSKLSSESTVLDIGTGDGAFLLELYERNWRKLTGIEPSAAPVNAANPKIKSFIRNEMFDPAKLLNNHYNLITLFQTIEHLENPYEVIKNIYNLLSPGGTFVIICHNFDSLSRNLLGMKSPIFDVEHLQLFRAKSARKLLENIGFTDINIKNFWNNYPLRYWMNLLPVPKELKSKLSTILSGRLGSIPVSIPAGNIFIRASKPV